MNNEVLIRYICDVAKKAEANMEPCKARAVHLVVPKVRSHRGSLPTSAVNPHSQVHSEGKADGASSLRFGRVNFTFASPASLNQPLSLCAKVNSVFS